MLNVCRRILICLLSSPFFSPHPRCSRSPSSHFQHYHRPFALLVVHSWPPFAAPTIDRLLCKRGEERKKKDEKAVAMILLLGTANKSPPFLILHLHTARATVLCVVCHVERDSSYSRTMNDHFHLYSCLISPNSAIYYYICDLNLSSSSSSSFVIFSNGGPATLFSRLMLIGFARSLSRSLSVLSFVHFCFAAVVAVRVFVLHYWRKVRKWAELCWRSLML